MGPRIGDPDEVRYFTADLHLQHPLLADLRGFPTPAAHDAAVMAALYRLDPDSDELWVLGDICTGGTASMRAALAQLATLRVPLHLVAGNHDPVHSCNRKPERHLAEYRAVFRSVQEHATTDLGGVPVQLSHFPYLGTEDRFSRDRFTEFQLPERGDWLLHGHTHAAERRSGERSICVSLEAWDLRPASETEIILEMAD